MKLLRTAIALFILGWFIWFIGGTYFSSEFQVVEERILSDSTVIQVEEGVKKTITEGQSLWHDIVTIGEIVHRRAWELLVLVLVLLLSSWYIYITSRR